LGTCLLKHIKDPYREKLREAIRNRVDSYSKSILKASSGRMHLAREMYRDVVHMETVEIPGEFVDKTFFRYLKHGRAGSAEGKLSGITPSTNNIPFTASTVLDTRVTGISTHTGR